MTDLVKQMNDSLKTRDVGAALLDLIQDFSGKVGYVVRNPAGKPRLMTVRFGPRERPTVELEIRDIHNQEDPLQREQRLHDAKMRQRQARFDQQQSAIDVAVKQALREQRAQLAEEWGITSSEPAEPAKPAPRRAAKADGDRWSKRTFTDAVENLFSDSDLDASVIREDAKTLLVTLGDQTFRVAMSMPRS